MISISVTMTGHGPPLIMLHGWGQTKRAMAPLARMLREKFRVITFDLPGHGAAKDENGPFDFKRFVDSLSDVVESLGEEPYHLLGWSMGGTVAAIYCLENIGRFPASLTLLSATPKFVIPEKNLGIGQHPVAVKKMERMIRADPDAGLRDFIGRFFESGEVMTKKKRSDIEKIFYSPDFPPKKEALLESLADLSAADLTAMKGAYDGPVLLIYGRLDRICPVGGQRLWKEVFRRVEESSIDGAGHAPHLTRTDEVARAIEKFILDSD